MKPYDQTSYEEYCLVLHGTFHILYFKIKNLLNVWLKLPVFGCLFPREKIKNAYNTSVQQTELAKT